MSISAVSTAVSVDSEVREKSRAVRFGRSGRACRDAVDSYESTLAARSGDNVLQLGQRAVPRLDQPHTQKNKCVSRAGNEQAMNDWFPMQNQLNCRGFFTLSVEATVSESEVCMRAPCFRGGVRAWISCASYPTAWYTIVFWTLDTLDRRHCRQVAVLKVNVAC